jgi:hypothetical protein
MPKDDKITTWWQRATFLHSKMCNLELGSCE